MVWLPNSTPQAQRLRTPMAFICYAGLQFGKGLVGEAHLCSMKKELRQPAWNCRISFQDGSLTPWAAWCQGLHQSRWLGPRVSIPRHQVKMCSFLRAGSGRRPRRVYASFSWSHCPKADSRRGTKAHSSQWKERQKVDCIEVWKLQEA